MLVRAHITGANILRPTVGDPLKDTSGPALNIVMKLTAILSLVFGSAIADAFNLPVLDEVTVVHLFTGAFVARSRLATRMGVGPFVALSLFEVLLNGAVLSFNSEESLLRDL